MKGTEIRIPWNGRDVLLVSAILVLSGVMAMILSFSIPANEHVQASVFSCLMGPALFISPVLWVRKRYGTGIAVFGWRRGKWRPVKIGLVGVLSGGAYFALFSLLWPGDTTSSTVVTSCTTLLPVSLYALGSVVLAPISEELFFRGFLYSYLETSLGRTWGLIVQAAVFAIGHTAWSYRSGAESAFLVISAFAVAVIAAALYRASNSIYSSVIFHTVFNCLITITGG